MSVAITRGSKKIQKSFRSEMSRVHGEKIKNDFILPGPNVVVLTTELADQLVDVIAERKNVLNCMCWLLAFVEHT